MHPPLAPDHVDVEHRHADLGRLELESGEAIEDYRQSYVVHGTLAKDRGNVVLACPALTATHHRLDFLIGPGKALDPARWFVVVADPIGNGQSTSPSNSRLQPRMRFPRFVLRDMVTAQHRLLREHLGIERVHAVIGASMGGMQALQWAVRHSDFMDRIVAMTPMPRTEPWAVLVTETARSCLMADPAWNGTEFTRVPERGWRAYAGLMNALLMRSPDALHHLPDFHATLRWFEGIHAGLGATGFDAHDYLYQSWAYQAHDVGTTPGFGGDTARALASIEARALVLAPPLDLFNPASSARDAAAAMRNAFFVEVPSRQGHLAASSTSADDAAFLNRVVGRFLVED